MESLGLTVGMIVGITFVVLLFATGILMLFWSRRLATQGGFSSEDDSKIVLMFSIIAFVSALILLIAALWPFNAKYYQAYTITGEITSVSNVVTEASGDFSRTPVVEMEGFPLPLTVDDPRAVTLQDKTVTLRCGVDWNYQAEDTWRCTIRKFA